MLPAPYTPKACKKDLIFFPMEQAMYKKLYIFF